jgi:acyl dehydratase
MTVMTGTDLAAVKAGQQLPPLTIPVTYTTLALDVAGTRDFYPIHHDPDFAKDNGVANIFLNTMWYQGLIGRFVTEWGGPESFLRKLKVDMKANGSPGDTQTVRGTVLSASRDDRGRKLVDIDVRIDNQRQPDAVIAKVTLELA